MESDRNGFEHGGLGKRKLVGQRVHDAGRDSDQFGEGSGATVVPARDTEDFAAVAQVDIAAAAVWTIAAIDGRIDGNPIACREPVYSFSHCRNGAGGFVPHDKRWNSPARGSVVAVDITTANAAGGDADQNLVVPKFRCRHVRELELSIFRE